MFIGFSVTKQPFWGSPFYGNLHINIVGSMYGIYGNIYHAYPPNVSIYTSTMDPMGINIVGLDFTVPFLGSTIPGHTAGG